MHVNYRRGETKTFCWRKEHFSFTHRTFIKGKRDSARWYKVNGNRQWRRKCAQALFSNTEDPFPKGWHQWNYKWFF